MKSKVTENQFFSNSILSWYQENPRHLPWRETQDPYKIWLSEIILQQTRVAQGLPYYEAFSKAYPSVQALAEAPEEEVLRLWQGLGYYSRARNLHACAKYIWNELGGNFPNSYASLIQLKGVGSYTAAAISSFAFGEVQAVVDGNVFRVLARYFGIATDIASGKGKKEFEAIALFHHLYQSQGPTYCLSLIELNFLETILIASSPEIRITEIAPIPEGVANAMIESF